MYGSQTKEMGSDHRVRRLRRFFVDYRLDTYKHSFSFPISDHTAKTLSTHKTLNTEP
jgi:hypothetical protein